MIDIRTTLTQAEKAKIASIDNKVDKVYGYGLSENSYSDAEKEYLDNMMYGERYAVTSTRTSNSQGCDYYQDSVGYDFTVTATVKFDDTNVNANSTPEGWNKTSGQTGVYTKTIKIKSGVTRTIASQAFSYTYQGVVLTKNSTAYTGNLYYPIYIGLYPSQSIEAATVLGETSDQTVSRVLAEAIKTDYNTVPGRILSNMTSSTKYNIVNGTAYKQYIWMITPNAITISQLGNAIPVRNEDGTFTVNSPIENHTSITMSGYRVTIAKAALDPSGSAQYEFTSSIKYVS